MSALQRRLTEFLECDLAHSLGAMSKSASLLDSLRTAMQSDALVRGQSPNYGPLWKAGLLELVELSARYAGRLDRWQDAAINATTPGIRDRGIGLHRHPLPPSPLPLRPGLRFGDSKEERRAKERDERFRHAAIDPTRAEVIWPSQFYSAASAALTEDLDATSYPNLAALRGAILHKRSPGVANDRDVSQVRFPRREKYVERYSRRRADWAATFGTGLAGEAGPKPEPSELLERIAGLIVGADLGSDAHQDLAVRQPLPLFVLRALVDGHLGMHVAVAFQQRPLHQVLADDNDAAARRVAIHQVKQSIELLTFARTAVRVAPQMFAEGAAERDHVLERTTASWQHVVPSRAMWIGTQVAVLALYRRAHCHVLLGDRRKAYNDFHKLQADIRDAQRRLRSSPLHVGGAHEFLQSLDALADYHMGELYRSDRQFQGAATHLSRSRATFDRLSTNEDRRPVIANARWLIQLHLSLGKTHYELGRHKSALIAFLLSWKALLDLIAADTGTEVEHEPLTLAIDELSLVEDEPLLYVSDVKTLLAPIVEQIEASYVDKRFTALASEVLLRIGQVLLVTRVDRVAAGSGQDAASRPRLAAKVILRASHLDPNATLSTAGLYRLFALEALWGPDLTSGTTGNDPDAPMDEFTQQAARRLLSSVREDGEEQWAGGQDLVESFARTIDLSVVAQVAAADNIDADDRVRLARRLLLGFLSHTDSIEARRSQVHRHLTEPRDRPAMQEPSIEFACLRRYSSAFPLVPRAENSRSHGGGYFVRLVPGDLAGTAKGTDAADVPVGIVVDPGTSFLECFFRSPYALANIDGIIVTHDHIDHASMLEPLLAALYESRGKLDPTDRPAPWIAGNDSVVARLQSISTYRLRLVGDSGNGPTLYRLAAEDDVRALSKRINDRWAKQLPGAKGNNRTRVEIVPVSSRTLDGVDPASKIQHSDLISNPSIGVQFKLANGRSSRASLYLAGDMPAKWHQGDATYTQRIEEALGSDVVVAHVSTVPLTELRQMADFPSLVGADDRLNDALREDSAAAPNDRLSPRRRAGFRIAAAAEKSIERTVAMWNAVVRDQAKLRRLEYAYWLTSDDGSVVRPVEHGIPEGGDGPVLPIALREWLPYSDHLYLGGLLDWARRTRRESGRAGRVLVLGELSEELGSFRRRIAHELNTLWDEEQKRKDDQKRKREEERKEAAKAAKQGGQPSSLDPSAVDGGPGKRTQLRAMTSDLGLRILVVAASGNQSNVLVSCSSCELDNDCAEEELWHHPEEIREVCIKGENEGVFYNCGLHDPGRNERGEEAFIEKFERYDVFGA